MHVAPRYRPGCAEFPHDNPRLDACAIWVMTPAPGAPRRTDAPALPPARDNRSPPSASATRATAATPATTSTAQVPTCAAPQSPPLSSQPFTTFTRTLLEVLRAQAAVDPSEPLGAMASEALSSLLVGMAPRSLNAPLRDVLLAGHIVVASDPPGGSVAVHPAFASTCAAWRAVLCEQQGDLAACGDSTLDSFAAHLIAHLVGAPHRQAEIRRDLRRRGVAAFGLVEVG